MTSSPADSALERLAERLWWFTSEGDPLPLVDDEALADAQAVFRASVGLDRTSGRFVVSDPRGATIVALAHWYRYSVLPKGMCENDLVECHVLLNLLGEPNIDELSAGLRIPKGDGHDRIALDSTDSAVKAARAAVGRFDESGDIGEIDETLGHIRARVIALETVEPRLPPLLDVLVHLLARKYLAEPSRLSWLDEAVAVARRSVEITAEEDPVRADRLHVLATMLGRRGMVAGRSEASQEALDLLRLVVAGTPETHPRHAERVTALTELLLNSARPDAPVDTDVHAEAIALLAKTAAAGEETQPVKTLGLYAEALIRRAHAKPETLDEAISAQREVLSRFPEGHRERSGHLVKMGNLLAFAARHRDGHANLDEAVTLLREGAGKASPAERGPGLLALGAALTSRFAFSADPADLDEALSATRDGVGMMHMAGADDLAGKETLAGVLLRRFEHFLGRSDLVEALPLLREVASRTVEDDPQYGGRLANLAIALSWHAEHCGVPGDLDDAVEIYDRALPRVSGSARADLLASLAASLAKRGRPRDLDDAVEFLREAVDLTPDGHPRQAIRLANLGTTLHLRAERRGDGPELNEAVRVLRQALAHLDDDHPDRAWLWGDLGLALMHRFPLTHHPKDKADAIEALRASIGHRQSPAAIRVSSAMLLGRFGADHGDAEAALTGFASAVGLLPTLAWQGNARGDQEQLLGQWRTVATDAAAWAIEAGQPERAVDLIERGRHVLWSRDLDGREGGGALDLSELARVLGDGTAVIVNVSRYRCDALLVKASGVVPVALPGLTDEEVTTRAHTFLGALLRLDSGPGLGEKVRLLEQLRETLDWLWKTVAKPVLDALGESASRVWWSPTGLLAILPVHAAGAFDPAEGTSVLDRVISSYAGSLRMLVQSHSPGSAADDDLMAVVAVPETPDLPALLGVAEEVGVIRRLVPRPPVVVEGASATRANVLAALLEHQFVHFACHATQDPVNPSDGGIFLHDGKLGLHEIAAVPGGADLAFLSACRTGTGAVDVPDEALHVAAGFQAAGFRHVIGTLWSIEDQSAAQFTEAVYAQLVQGTVVEPERAAAAVHEAVLRLRARDRYDVTRWGLWFHLGP